jgi:hypothetical protein
VIPLGLHTVVQPLIERGMPHPCLLRREPEQVDDVAVVAALHHVPCIAVGLDDVGQRIDGIA